MTTTRRETRSNLGVAKNSRTAKRYAIPASVKEAMKYGPPRSPKLREQMVSATTKVAPSTYTLHSGVTFTVLSVPVRLTGPVANSHSLSHAAVRGALAGASRNSSAKRVRSSATSIS